MDWNHPTRDLELDDFMRPSTAVVVLLEKSVDNHQRTAHNLIKSLKKLQKQNRMKDLKDFFTIYRSYRVLKR